MDSRFQHVKDAGKRAKLEILRTAVKPILANNLLPHFTDHSLAHSDEIVTLIDKLIEPIQAQGNPHKLQDDELFVLYSACYLHDIGMQYENAGKTRTVSELYPGQPWEGLAEETRRITLRRHHHQISAEMVQNSVRSATPPIGIQLDDTDHSNEIACLCESHATDAFSARYYKLTQPAAGLRMSLLAVLLRIADILEESRRRAAREKARTLLLDLESQVHWWRHYYVEAVVVCPNNKTITLHFDLPLSRYEEYRGVVPRLQMPLIENEIRIHGHVLNPYGLHYTIQYECPKKDYSAAEEMPSQVFDEMRNTLRRQDEQERERTNLLALRESSERCRELIHQIGLLPEQGLPVDQLMAELQREARELWNAGGKRSGWMLLASAYHKYAPALQPEDRLETGTSLAEMMLEDRFLRESVSVLAEIQGLSAELPENHKTRRRFSAVWARALSLACINEAVDAYVEAIRLCPDENERKMLAAELAEHRFLRGDLEEVRDLTKEALCDVRDPRHNTRERLVALRNLAMLEGRCVCLPLIESTARSISGLEKTAALMLKAEIIFLDGDAAAAKEVFCTEMDPVLPDDGGDLTLAVADNRNVVAAHSLDPDSAKDFYALVDERRKRNIDLWDAHEILVADEAASEGKHYDALPRYWSELVRTYRRRYWRGYWWASERMAQECLALGLPHEAAFHAMVAQTDKLTERIAEMLFQKRNPEFVSGTVAILLRGAKLARHAAFAASLLGKLGDIIVESDLPKVAAWLADWTCRTDLAPPFAKTTTAAWEALARIAYRLSEKEADKVIRQAQGDPAWKNRGQLRKHIISAVNVCVKSASVETVSQLSEDCLRLVGEWKSDFDYSDAVNLVCNVYLRVDDGQQKMMAKSLFPPGQNVSDPKKLQAASVIGIELGDEHLWSERARSAAGIVSQHVRRIAKGDKPTVAFGSYGTHISFSKPDEPQVVVQIDSGVYLDALFGNRTKMNPDAMEELTRALCKMLMEPENSINNKRILVNALRSFADAIPQCLYHEVHSALEPLYHGRIVEPTTGMTHAEAESPLNPFKMSMGNPKQLRGEALIAVAKFSSLQEGGIGEQFERALKQALTDEDGEMRLFGFAAVRELAVLPSSAVSALIMGTRDPDPDAARMAFDALVGRESLSLDDPSWRLLLFSMRMALKADDVGLRRIAATAVSELLKRSLQGELKTELTELQVAAHGDFCYSVRARAGSQAP